MKTKLRTLTPEEHKAIQAAAYLHGRNFKTAIRTAWFTGGYRHAMLEDYSGTLQRMRNSGDGRAVLDSLKVRDFVAKERQAYEMGASCARGSGLGNPFGPRALAEAWRKGYTVTRDNALMAGTATPQTIKPL